MNEERMDFIMSVAFGVFFGMIGVFGIIGAIVELRIDTLVLGALSLLLSWTMLMENIAIRQLFGSVKHICAGWLSSKVSKVVKGR